MNEFFLGTMGFSYGDWKGVFYPSGISSKDYLAQYARVFNCVEMDTTFYAAPRIDVVRSWAGVVPEGFLFTVKTPRSITHELGLANCSEFMDEFINVVRYLGEKLGGILIQLPPSYTSDKFPILAAFVDKLPNDIRFAIEFRHQSWYTTKTGEFLTAHGICWASSEYANLPHQITPTTNFLYLRWLGKHAAFRQYNREQIDQGSRLAWWVEEINNHLGKVKIVFGFFNNDYSGFAPATCNRLKALLNLPVVDFQQPQQGRLF